MVGISFCALEEIDLEKYPNNAPPRPAPRPTPEDRDLDDLIFQGEGWLASDR